MHKPGPASRSDVDTGQTSRCSLCGAQVTVWRNAEGFLYSRTTGCPGLADILRPVKRGKR